jgi:two-component system chemotaxis response regulator CheB
VPTGDPAQDHHLVVVGASAGGVEALQALVAGLPPDFPDAVAVVVHLRERGPSAMPEILARACALPAANAVDGEPIAGGRIYVAPPGSHLTVDGDRLRLDAGPSLNGHRPAIDRLFETAAETRGERTIGVILSGMLEDGARGLAAVQQHGGLTIVQDPADAVYRSMPTAALRRVEPDFILPAAAIGAALADSVTLRLAGMRDEEPA